MKTETGLSKICTKCKIEKSAEKFYRSSGNGSSWCKSCYTKKNAQWSKKNPIKMSEAKKRWAEKNPEKRKEATKRWENLNKGKVKKYHCQYEKDNKEKRNAQHKLWREMHPEIFCASLKKCRETRIATAYGKLNKNMATAICRSLKGNKKNRHWEFLVGFTTEQLKQHLESQFKEGMSWGNYGKWHLDHRVPIAVHNYEKPEDIDFKRCWSLTNFQPLWAKENKIKNAKLEVPFQSSLLLTT